MKTNSNAKAHPTPNQGATAAPSITEHANAENQYLLIFRGTDWFKDLTPGERQIVSDQWSVWFNQLKSDGTVTSGAPLQPRGKVVSGRTGRVVVDGPFAESKEAIGGFFLLNVSSLEEAVAIAQQCPGLVHGLKVEVRPVAARCPVADGFPADSASQSQSPSQLESQTETESESQAELAAS